MTDTRSAVTTHVLDTALGRPAAGVPVLLQRQDGSTLGKAHTDDDGRAADLGPAHLEAGTYRIVFDTATYFAATGQRGFYPEVAVTFTLADPEQHYHVPVLLSPFAYSTYRGS
jgi:5-hydroxyisourate hydrolase